MGKNKIDRIVNTAYYLNADMIRFLLIENLALKTLLHEKGLITPEQFKECQDKAAAILDEKVKVQLAQWKKTNPEGIRLFEEAMQEVTQKEDSVAS